MSSARAAYPVFLSVQESLWLQLNWAWCGLRDAFQWPTVLSVVLGDAEIRANVYKSLLLNVLSLISVFIFDILFLPLVTTKQIWLYQILWLLPVVGTSYYLNSTWCTVIAKRTYRLQYGSHGIATPQPVSYTGMLTTIATSAYRVVMVVTSVVTSFALARIPYAGSFASFLFISWIDSYYCFEFVWIARGMSLARRIRHLEERWAYYLAFGLPSAVLCTFGSSITNLVVFALIFPVYIIMAMHARPVPADPYNPLATQEDVLRHPSPFIPIRIPIFAPVVFLNDWIIVAVSVASGGRRRPPHSRAYSDNVETMEDGGQELKFDQPPPVQPQRVTTNRIKLGRRKED